MTTPASGSPRRPRLGILSFSSGEFDARSFRIARSAIAAGYDVTLYTRWHAGQRPVEEREGYRLVRVPFDWRFILPWRRAGLRVKTQAAMAAAARAHAEGHGVVGSTDDPSDIPEARPRRVRDPLSKRVVLFPLRVVRGVIRRTRRLIRRSLRVSMIFPLRPMGWAVALDDYAEPADIWHGMWAGSLPALARLRRRHGGRTIYDSRDVYMLSRDFESMRWPMRPILAWSERHWARRVDRVLTVNDPYADLIVRELGVPRPPVVINTPERWTPPDPAPDLIRDVTGIPATTAIALYQGQLVTDRGIEQAMDAILAVPGAVLVLLGYGRLEATYRQQSEEARYKGRVFVLPAVPPHELMAWSASADVMVMPIQPSTTNHLFTTPQKLWEAIAAGIPVVASDLPGMATVVREAGVGVLVDPTRPESIATGIREVLERSPADRAALRAHVLGVAHRRFNWEAQLETLFGLYHELYPDAPDAATAIAAAGIATAIEEDAAPPDEPIPPGPALWFMAAPPAPGTSLPDDATVVVVDTSLVLRAADASPRVVLLRDAVERVLREHDLPAEAVTALDGWAEASGIVELMAVGGTSHWYGARLGHWMWILDQSVWLGALDLLLTDHPGTSVLVLDPDTDPLLAEAAALVAARDGITVVERRSAVVGLFGGLPARTRVYHPPRKPQAMGARASLSWRFRPPEPERRLRVIMGRVERLAAEPERPLLVVNAHVPQRVETQGGARMMNIYLGPIADRLRKTRLRPVEVELGLSILDDAEGFARLEAKGAARTLPGDVIEVLSTDIAPAPYRAEAAAVAARIAEIRVPTIVGGVDLGPALAAHVARRTEGTLGRRVVDSERIRRLLRKVRPAGILLADEYHRQDWMAAAAAEGVPLAAVQHGIIRSTHVGYIHRDRPPVLRLPDVTYLFGRWEADLITASSVYRPEEVVVGGSPRLDLVPMRGPGDVAERDAVRAELGIDPGDRMVVMSGTWGPQYRRFHFPITIDALFCRPIERLHLVVKLHPSERDEGPYRAMIEALAAAGGFEPPRITVVQRVDLYRLLAAADAHLGIHSTVLTEAVATGTPNLLASGLAGADPLGYVAAGVAIPVRTPEDITGALALPRDEALPPEARAAFLAAHFEPGAASERIAADLLDRLS